MGFSIFNPPEPHGNPHRGCGTCTAVPKLWKLTVPEYQTSPQFGSPLPGNVILRRTTAKTDDNIVLPRWVPQNSQVETAGDFDWRLEYRPSFATAEGPLPSIARQDYWVIWIPSSPVVGGVRREVYYITTPFSHQIPPDLEDINAESHFKCLGRNRFWYVDSITNVGQSSTTEAEEDGWPEHLWIEPWYGQ